MFVQLKKWVATLGAAFALVLALGYAPAAPAQVPPEQMTTTEARDASMVFHHLERYAPAIEILEREGPPLLRRMEAALGLEDMPVIDVWILPEVADYFELNERPASAPEWAVGLSFSGQAEIIVAHGGQRPPQEVMRTFAHELAHVAVDHARGGASVPRWFHEGFAVMMAQEWTPERSEKLAQAAASGTLQSFEDLWDSFPSHHQSASLAYDQSFHFVRWLQNQYGDDLFARVMGRIDPQDRQEDSPAEISQQASFRQALEEETGTSFGRLEAEWRDSLAGSTSIWSILRDEMVIFFGAGVLFLIAYVVARRRRRRQFESMEDEDAGEWSYDESRYPLPGDDS